MTSNNPSPAAKLTLLPNVRKTPIKSGYRAILRIDGQYWTAQFTLLDREWLYPGESCPASVKMLVPQELPDGQIPTECPVCQKGLIHEH